MLRERGFGVLGPTEGVRGTYVEREREIERECVSERVCMDGIERICVWFCLFGVCHVCRVDKRIGAVLDLVIGWCCLSALEPSRLREAKGIGARGHGGVGPVLSSI